MNESETIPIPPVSLARLEQLITQRNALDGQIDAIIATLREVLRVPDNYNIGDIRRGFTPARQGQE